jgi:hypothetical protein
MNKKLQWKEIIKKYPNQWVSLCDLEYDENNDMLIKAAVVFAADKEFKVVAQKSKGVDFKNHEFQFTGEINPQALLTQKWKINAAVHD